MKRTFVKVAALALAIITLTCMLASCGTRLSGTYSNEVEAFGIKSGTSYTFKGNKVTITMTLVGQSEQIEGTYKIDGDKITFEFENDSELLEEASGTVDFEKGDDYIKIAGIKYTKAD